MRSALNLCSGTGVEIDHLPKYREVEYPNRLRRLRKRRRIEVIRIPIPELGPEDKIASRDLNRSRITKSPRSRPLRKDLTRKRRRMGLSLYSRYEDPRIP